MQHIKSALTGRVAHNHCVVKALQTDLDIELLEFICKVHLIAKKKVYRSRLFAVGNLVYN